jgi:hypothetical protein
MPFPPHSERFSSRISGRRPVRLSVMACLSLAVPTPNAGANFS